MKVYQMTTNSFLNIIKKGERVVILNKANGVANVRTLEEREKDVYVCDGVYADDLLLVGDE